MKIFSIRSYCSLIYFLHICATLVSSREHVVTIGALFDSEDAGLPSTLRNAVERLNQEKWLRHDLRLTWGNVHVAVDASFAASKKACSMLKSGAAALIGPQTVKTSAHIQSLCKSLEVPHIQMSEDFRSLKDDSSVNVAPHPSSVSRAFADLIIKWDWYDSYTIMYDDFRGLERIQELLKIDNRNVFLYQLAEDGDDRPFLKTLMKTQRVRIILECSLDKILKLLRQARQLNMTTEYFDYVVTNLDVHTLDMEEFKDAGMNFTAFQLIHPENSQFYDILRRWRMLNPTAYNDIPIDYAQQGITTETALLYDAVLLVANALNEADRGRDIEHRFYDCDYDGLSYETNPITEVLRQSNVTGLTGPIYFDSQGFRTNFNLNIIKHFNHNGKKVFRKIGSWDPESKVTFDADDETMQKETDASLQGKKLRVSTIENKPFIMLKADHEEREGNDRFEGFTVDLCKELALVTNFTFEINLVEDGQYGGKDANGIWNGMVGEVVSKKADLVVADLTITKLRQSAVDFSIPFMNLGISILFKKQEPPPTSLFSFTKPFKDEVWIYLGTVYLGVSVLLFVLARLTPYEWDNPHPCNSEPEELENQFDLLNSMWFSVGSLTGQGCDILPKAVSTRTLGSIWWFFVLIMIASYTANLAAFLTAEKSSNPINDVEDLARQTEIKYGCVKGASTSNFFKNSNSETYKKMHTAMDTSEPSVYAKNNDEGVQRVLRGGYAFFMESTVIDYRVQRNCQLYKVGSPLDNKGYGVATAKNSPYRTKLNFGILKLQDEGKFISLQQRWWEQSEGVVDCGDESVGDDGKLGIENVGGVFALLFMGVGVGIIVGCLEFCWFTKHIPRSERGSICSEIFKELKFSFQINETTKPIPKTFDDLEETEENGNGDDSNGNGD